jgi:hypothetical protein
MTSVLKIDSLQDLEGAIIEWQSPGSKDNGIYRGIAQIVSVDVSSRKPIRAITLSGEDLNFAFIEYGHINYSDFGRFISYTEVTYELLSDKGEILDTALEGSSYLVKYNDVEFVILADNTVITRAEDHEFGDAIFPVE